MGGWGWGGGWGLQFAILLYNTSATLVLVSWFVIHLYIHRGPNIRRNSIFTSTSDYSSVQWRSVLHILVTCSSHVNNPDSKVHGANMGPTWVLTGPDEPHVGPMNLAIREVLGHACHIWSSLGLKSSAHNHSIRADPVMSRCVVAGMFDRKRKGVSRSIGIVL